MSANKNPRGPYKPPKQQSKAKLSSISSRNPQLQHIPLSFPPFLPSLSLSNLSLCLARAFSIQSFWKHMMDASGEIFVDHDTTIIPENLVPHETHRDDDDSNLIPQEPHGHDQETHGHEDDSDLVPQQTHGHDDSEIGGGEKKWPGWPGENVFRLIVPSQKVGGIIGRKGEFIKKMCEESRARIKILDGPHGTHQRAVLVSAREEPDSPLPPAMNGLLRVHKRIIDGLEGDPSQAPPGGTASTRLLMPASQAGNLIGKQGATIKSIQDAANCIIRVLGPEELPIFALQDDRVVEIVGEPAAVHKALELAATHLRKFLVDRSVIGIFEMQMQNPHPHMESPMDYNMPPHQSWEPPRQSWEPPHQSWEPPHQSWGPPQGPSQGFTPNLGGGPGFGPNPQYNMMPPRQHDNYYPPADIPPIEKPPHQGLSMYGRDASMGPHSAPNAQQQQAVVTQVTQHMQVPLSFADAVIGDAGANISYIRRASGATITIQETRGVPGEMTVEINGTASEVQTAQQLIQNFMAEAAGSQQNNQANAPQDNSYPPHSSVYSSPPSNTGHAPQAAGGYPSGYGNNYGGNTYGY